MGNNETTPLRPDSLLGGFTKMSESWISETTDVEAPHFMPSTNSRLLWLPAGLIRLDLYNVSLSVVNIVMGQKCLLLLSNVWMIVTLYSNYICTLKITNMPSNNMSCRSRDIIMPGIPNPGDTVRH